MILQFNKGKLGVGVGVWQALKLESQRVLELGLRRALVYGSFCKSFLKYVLGLLLIVLFDFWFDYVSWGSGWSRRRLIGLL